MSWKWGLQYQGARYTDSVLALNVIWLAGLRTMSYVCCKREPSFTTSLTLHWLLFAWVAWYAFPYLGELP